MMFLSRSKVRSRTWSPPAQPTDHAVGRLGRAVAADRVQVDLLQDLLAERQGAVAADPITHVGDATVQEPHRRTSLCRAPRSPAGPSNRPGPAPGRPLTSDARRGSPRAATAPARPAPARVVSVGDGQVKLTNWSGYSGPFSLRWAITAWSSSIFLPVTRTLLSMICAWTFTPSCLICLTIFLASSVSIPMWSVSDLADRVVRRLLELAALQGVDGHPALGHLLLEHLDHRVELPLVVGQEGQRVVLLVVLDRRRASP